MDIKIINPDQYFEVLNQQRKSYQDSYLAMYSSLVGGIITDPALMMLPIDDHMVHRGDGIFEAFKTRGDGIYLLDAHLERLQRSAKAISLELPNTRDEIIEIINATKQAAKEKDLLFRLYVSRGPGGFTTNPYETIGSQLYVVATKLKLPKKDLYEKGAKLKKSEVPMKDEWMAQVKSCNYLPNVMMKKEAVDSGVDFTVNFNVDGFMGEGSTENIVIVSEDGRLLFPHFDQTLKGTTLVRLSILAKSLVDQGIIKDISESALRIDDLKKAKEAFVVGTTLDVLPITQFEGAPIGDGLVGPIAKKCRELIKSDI